MSEAATKDDDLGFDPKALKAKYRAERDKRLRQDGSDQYLEMKGKWAHYVEDDPYADADFVRDPVTDLVDGQCAC